MRNKGPLVFILLAVVLAVGAAWAARQWINQQAVRVANARVAVKPVLVAARDLPAGHRISQTDLATRAWPISGLPTGHFNKASQLNGRVLRRPLLKGEVVIQTALAAKGIAGGLSAMVPSGFRAVTVRVDEVIGVAGFVQAGDRVDVYVTVATGPFKDNPSTKVVLQDVAVLTVGARVEEVKKGGRPQREKVKVVTLKLSPDQGERLALAVSEGRLLLGLRNQGDHQISATPGVQLTGLMPFAQTKKCPKQKLDGKPAAGKPTKLARKSDSIEVIKGVKVTRQEL